MTEGVSSSNETNNGTFIMNKKFIKQLKRDAAYDLVDAVVGKKHNKIYFTNGVLTRYITVSKSPSDVRAYKNILRDVRNLFA